MTMSRLADQLDVSLPNVTGIVDRMVERGLVERTATARTTGALSESDHRRRPRSVLDEIDTSSARRWQTVIGRLTPEQQDRALRAFTDMRVAAETARS